jgi:hypothetical protein
MPDDRQVSSDASGPAGPNGRVVALRPPKGLGGGGKARRLSVIDPRQDPAWLTEQPHGQATGLAADDEHEDDGDRRYRMLSNLVGVALIAILIGAGVWLAHAIADMRKIQDCVLSGRGNCAPIELPASAR